MLVSTRMYWRATTRTLLAVAPLMFTGCDPDEAAVELDDPAAASAYTWEEFLASGIAIPSRDGGWTVEGDIAIADEEALRAFHERFYAVRPRAYVEKSGGNDDILDVARKLNLSYCVSDAFGVADKALLIQRMQQAAMEWERATDVNFIYRELGAACVVGAASVYFVVELELFPTDPELCARAAFPSNPVKELLITPFGLSSVTCNYANGKLLRHELGHILGFHHEHARVPGGCEQPTMFDPHFLSEKDTRSIMAYSGVPSPIDDDPNNNEICTFVPLFSISRRDVAAAKFLYSLPKGHWLGRTGSSSLYHGTRLNSDNPRDIFWYTPSASAHEVVQIGSATGMTSLAVPSDAGIIHKPIVGRFSTDTLSDILLYSPYAAQDRLYVATSSMASFTTSNKTISGFHQPIVGHFGTNSPASGRSDIFMYGPGPDTDMILQADGGASVFTQGVVPSIGNASNYYVPISGDFDGDGDTDIFFYNPDSSTNPSQLMTTTGAYTFSVAPMNHWSFGALGNQDSGFFYSHATGDFDGDGAHDIFWYAPQQANSGRFWRGSASTPLTTTTTQNMVSNDSFRLFTGDFNGDSRTDILWYNQNDGLDANPHTDQVWLMGSGFSRTVVNLDLGGADFNLVVSDYDGDGLDDLYVWDPNGSDTLRTSNGDGTFTTLQTLTGHSGYAVGYAQG